MAYVYLVKLFGMHKIGRTDNFERRMEQLQPAVLIAKKKHQPEPRSRGRAS